jgi:hypothetical protein
MDRPAKRRRLGQHRNHSNEDFDHEFNDTSLDPQIQERLIVRDKFKWRLESIFEKYGRDFTGIGDEIDLVTGKIVVDNGHLAHMTNEEDIGDGQKESGEDTDEDYNHIIQNAVSSNQMIKIEHDEQPLELLTLSATVSKDLLTPKARQSRCLVPAKDSKWQVPDLPEDAFVVVSSDDSDDEDASNRSADQSRLKQGAKEVQDRGEDLPESPGGSLWKYVRYSKTSRKGPNKQPPTLPEESVDEQEDMIVLESDATTPDVTSRLANLSSEDRKQESVFKPPLAQPSNTTGIAKTKPTKKPPAAPFRTWTNEEEDRLINYRLNTSLNFNDLEVKFPWRTAKMLKHKWYQLKERRIVELARAIPDIHAETAMYDGESLVGDQTHTLTPRENLAEGSRPTDLSKQFNRDLASTSTFQDGSNFTPHKIADDEPPNQLLHEQYVLKHGNNMSRSNSVQSGSLYQDEDDSESPNSDWDVPVGRSAVCYPQHELVKSTVNQATIPQFPLLNQPPSRSDMSQECSLPLGKSLSIAESQGSIRRTVQSQQKTEKSLDQTVSTDVDQIAQLENKNLALIDPPWSLPLIGANPAEFVEEDRNKPRTQVKHGERDDIWQKQITEHKAKSASVPHGKTDNKNTDDQTAASIVSGGNANQPTRTIVLDSQSTPGMSLSSAPIKNAPIKTQQAVLSKEIATNVKKDIGDIHVESALTKPAQTIGKSSQGSSRSLELLRLGSESLMQDTDLTPTSLRTCHAQWHGYQSSLGDDSYRLDWGDDLSEAPSPSLGDSESSNKRNPKAIRDVASIVQFERAGIIPGTTQEISSSIPQESSHLMSNGEHDSLSRISPQAPSRDALGSGLQNMSQNTSPLVPASNSGSILEQATNATPVAERNMSLSTFTKSVQPLQVSEPSKSMKQQYSVPKRHVSAAVPKVSIRVAEGGHDGYPRISQAYRSRNYGPVDEGLSESATQREKPTIEQRLQQLDADIEPKSTKDSFGEMNDLFQSLSDSFEQSRLLLEASAKGKPTYRTSITGNSPLTAETTPFKEAIASTKIAARTETKLNTSKSATPFDTKQTTPVQGKSDPRSRPQKPARQTVSTRKNTAARKGFTNKKAPALDDEIVSKQNEDVSKPHEYYSEPTSNSEVPLGYRETTPIDTYNYLLAGSLVLGLNHESWDDQGVQEIEDKPCPVNVAPVDETLEVEATSVKSLDNSRPTSPIQQQAQEPETLDQFSLPPIEDPSHQSPDLVTPDISSTPTSKPSPLTATSTDILLGLGKGHPLTRTNLSLQDEVPSTSQETVLSFLNSQAITQNSRLTPIAKTPIPVQRSHRRSMSATKVCGVNGVRCGRRFCFNCTSQQAEQEDVEF